MERKKVVICFVHFYLPGFRSGGPTRTVANFVDHLSNEFDIRVICCDRDLGDDKPFSDLLSNKWNKVGNSKVYYISPKKTNLFNISKILRETSHDILYLNSFFSYGFAIIPLLAKFFKLVPKVPIIIGPRGEFSNGALSLKAFKKKLFIKFVKTIGLYKNLYWQASSEFELADIQREFGSVAKKIYVARDLTPVNKIHQKYIAINKNERPLKIIFLSRITPMKNLDFLIDVLSKVSGKIEFNIFGPKQDLNYWEKCKLKLNNLPNNIVVNIMNEVPHDKVFSIFSQNDLFAFPTRGEALGHIILESLSASTPVLVSDKTSWLSDNLKGLQVIPLKHSSWIREIDEWIKISNDEINLRRKAAFNYAQKSYLENLKSIKENKKLFYLAAMKNK